MNIIKNELMKEGCLVDLNNPLALHEALLQRLAELGQMDGRWSDDQTITDIFKPEHKYSKEFQDHFKPEYVTAASVGLINLIDQHSMKDGMCWDVYWMSTSFAFEFSNGWKVFAVKFNGENHWMGTGMLFPKCDGKTEGMIVFALLDEIFTPEIMETLKAQHVA